MQALGMIETKGLIGSIEAADVMLKAANVDLINRHYVKGGIVIVEITGDVGAVQAAVDAGIEATKRLGVYLTSQVIPRPAPGIDQLLKREPKKVEKIEKIDKVEKIEKPEKIETVQIEKVETKK